MESETLMREFRESYAAARGAVDEGLSPLIVVRFNDVYLIRDREVVEHGIGVPAKYMALRVVAHVPLAIYLRLEHEFGSPLGSDAVAELAEIRAACDDAASSLAGQGFTAEEAAWQRAVIDATREFLDPLEAGAVVSESQFDAYQSRIHDPMMAMSDRAGELQVEALHNLMLAWRPLFSDEEWATVRVMVIGPRQPRNGCPPTRYFAALFGGSPNTLYPGESSRVFYVESVNIDGSDTSFVNERKLVATMILDGDASSVFFEDPHRMSSDVMSDGAARRIEALDLSALR